MSRTRFCSFSLKRGGNIRLIYHPTHTRLVFEDDRQQFDFLQSFTLDNPKWREASKLEKTFVFHDIESSTIPTGLAPAAVNWSRLRGIEPTAELFPEWFWIPPPLPAVSPGIIPDLLLRDYQCEAIAACASRWRGVVEIATGGGKTEIAIGLLLYIGAQEAVFVCPDTLALEEMYARFIGRGIPTRRLDSDGLGANAEYSVTVANIQALSSGLRRGDPEVFQLLEDADLLMVDECHHMHARTWRAVASHCLAERRIGFSATPYKDRSTRFCPYILHPFDSWLVGFLGDTLIYKPARELQANNHLARCTVVAFPTAGPVIDDESWHTVHREGILENESRNQQLALLAANLVDMGRRPLISVSEKEHGRVFQRLCLELGIGSVCSYGQGTVYLPRTLAEREGLDFEAIPIYDRSTRKKKPKIEGYEEDFVQLGADYDVRETVHRLVNGPPVVLIGSQLYDEVQSISCLTDLINADAGKADQRNTQKAGRILRLDGTNCVAQIWEPWDRSHYYLKRHSLQRLENAQAEGFPIISDPLFARFLISHRIKDYPWKEVTVRIDRVEVKCEMCIPNTPGAATYSNIKPAVTIGAQLEEGDDPLAVADRLSALAVYAFMREAYRAGGHIPILSNSQQFTPHLQNYLENCYPGLPT